MTAVSFCIIEFELFSELLLLDTSAEIEAATRAVAVVIDLLGCNRGPGLETGTEIDIIWIEFVDYLLACIDDIRLNFLAHIVILVVEELLEPISEVVFHLL